MRTFIAIEFSEEIKDTLSQAEAHLKYSGVDVKWVEKENIHLTIKFLGEVDEKKLEEIKTALDIIGSQTKPFDSTIKDLGVFPKIEYPRVIWAGIDKGALELKALSEKVDTALSKLGFEKEVRPFVAHLTIGRVRSPKNKEKLKEKMAAYKLPEIPPHRIDSILLFQSTLTPKGSIYTKLHEAHLTG
jgi:RNA 2',3'-cyclic 3'-phosphodiesterase